MVVAIIFLVFIGRVEMISVNDMLDNRYKIRVLIGRGGMSDVYEAYDIIMKRAVAIKIINEGNENNPESKTKFENEARISSSLNHPNIVKIFNYSFFNKSPYIVNEYQKGQTLKDTLGFKGYFTLFESCQIMIQILNALSYIHKNNIIHRDIKPQNIFYGSDGIIKVSDFGISIFKKDIERIKNAKKIDGTVQYLAPEVIRKNECSEQSDIYSAGITFFELLTGYLPFDEDNVVEVAKSHLHNEVPSPRKIMMNLPLECEEIIKKATEKDLSLRYKNADQMKKDIESIYNNKRIVSKGSNLFDKIFNRRKKRF